MSEPKLVIIGAGPTGLGAAYRLAELGYRNYQVLEARSHVGGLASSERSANGFTYDIGGHVLFSHYPYFDRLFDRLMGDEFQQLKRDAWIWMCGRYLPYPFQQHLHHLPPETCLECVLGLLDAQRERPDIARFRTFEELIRGVFGEGIARTFMLPYNFKVWAYPPSAMGTTWIGERVAVVDLKRVLTSVILHRDDVPWGPNAMFKYPRYGGTGNLFERIVPYIKDHLRLSTPVTAVDIERSEVILDDDSRVPYDELLTTMPLDLLVSNLRGAVPDPVRSAATRLSHSGSYIVGIGVDRPTTSSKCWVYFPQDDAPFYRLTYLSNYSPDVVPDAATQHSLLAEVSHSPHKPVSRESVVSDTIAGLISARVLEPCDLTRIVDTHVIERAYTYPTPTIERDDALAVLHPYLESRRIYSRGRFGAWRYEVGNMDHSVAQGVEWADRVLLGQRDDELTYLARRGC
ncbi:MAG TPA: FAD-dependent oxidoreductase [Gemmatimonadaceae bacterium]|nr:FAD-dependent oxidoreductase [Gemmatimonadaceae bacterium]